jgi:RNA ligase (TIGR02306 family)
MRKMATIRKIDFIRDIPGADSIECCTLGGWNVVTRKGEYTAGDLAVYCEIDSWIPHEIAPFLSKGNFPHVYNEVKGERLRTVKLRGQLSQGLLLPLHTKEIPNATIPFIIVGDVRHPVYEGDDVSELLGIVKYEAPIPASLAGEVKGMFPSRIPKTDQERIQNLSTELEEWKAAELTWEVTEKLDGSSMTVYIIDGEVGVCSRNLDLKPNKDNSLWATAYKNEIDVKLIQSLSNLAIQGELVGNGIQGNIYKMRDQEFYVYDIYDIDAGRYFTPTERVAYCKVWDIKHVPVFKSDFMLTTETVADLLQKAEGKSVMGDIAGPEREGLVYKCNEQQVSFKAISNKFLLKGGG